MSTTSLSSESAKTAGYQDYKTLEIARKGPAIQLTLNNPPMNSVEPEMHRELATIFRRVSEDQDARVIVLTGAGDKAFSAGADLKRMQGNLENRSLWTRQMGEQREIVLSILECEKPVICRINGHAMGVGATIAASCDISVMVETAKIADPHVKVGLVAGDGGALLWPGLIGMARARRYLLTGDALTGREAANIGLITEAVPAEELDAAVDRWVSYFESAAPLAISGTKRALNAALRSQGQLRMDLDLGLETLSFLSTDHREAVLAFIDKRDPKFAGR